MANTDPFTPEEVAQILEAFFATVGTRQYVGARYVPIFGRRGEASIVWDNTAPYEPLTIVLYQGNSFTSRQYVPEGVEITNEEFWAETGNYNAQIEQYRQEVLEAIGAIDSVREEASTALYSGYSGGLLSLDIRNDVVHDLHLESKTFQAMTLINGILYYNVVADSVGYLYSVPIDFSTEPTLLLQMQNLHAYSMGSLNAHTLLITYSSHYMLFDTNSNTYETYSMPTLWGFCCDRKTTDDSRTPDLCVAFDSMNNGIYRYGHLDTPIFQPAFSIPTAPIYGHVQDTAAYGYNVFELLVGTPGLSSDDLPFRYNYLYIFNANTANGVGLFSIICDNEIEGITVIGLSTAGNTAVYLADVKGKIYRKEFKIQPNALSTMFPGILKQHPLNRLNANNVTIETVTDTENNSFDIVTRFKMPHMTPAHSYMHYHPYLVNFGARANLYYAGLGAMYTFGTNGVYALYNRITGTNIYRLASITNNRTGISANYAYATNTIDKTFAQVLVTGNSILTTDTEGSELPDLTFEQ